MQARDYLCWYAVDEVCAKNWCPVNYGEMECNVREQNM